MQFTPSLAKGVEKVAFSDAMMVSATVADVTHAPMPGPFTAMIRGLGN